jgi:hypothetical protein
MNVFNFEVSRGDTWKKTLKFYSDSGRVDISTWTIFLTVKEKVTDPDASAKISKTITVHTDPTNGETQISLTSIDTDITVGNYVFDIQIVTPALADVRTILTGTFSILSDITIRNT